MELNYTFWLLKFPASSANNVNYFNYFQEETNKKYWYVCIIKYMCVF